DLEHTFADEYAGAAHPGRYHHPVSFIGLSVQYAGTTHLHALRDAPGAGAVSGIAVVAEQSGEGTVGAPGRRILGDTIERGEHPGPNVELVPAFRVEMNVGVYALGGDGVESRRTHPGPSQRRS